MGSIRYACFNLEWWVIDFFFRSSLPGAEYVVESTGLFTTINQCKPYLQAGVKKVTVQVVLSSSCKTSALKRLQKICLLSFLMDMLFSILVKYAISDCFRPWFLFRFSKVLINHRALKSPFKKLQVDMKRKFSECQMLSLFV